jgi:hypothetical protein
MVIWAIFCIIRISFVISEVISDVKMGKQLDKQIKQN